MVLAALATAFVLGVTTVMTVVTDGERGCGGGFAWGDWSVPINTVLLIILALVSARTRKKVEAVKSVTDTVKLRENSRRVDLEIDPDRSVDL